MPGINLEIITHESIQQKKRRFTREKNDIIKNKVTSLKIVGWVQKIDYSIWLSNVVAAIMVGVITIYVWMSLMLTLQPSKTIFLYQTLTN